MTVTRSASGEAVVITERLDATLVIRLNRPQARNAMNSEVREGIRRALAELASDSSLRVALLTGTGADFCAGADINEMAARTMLSSTWAPDRIDTVLEDVGKPVIAALHGHTLGGGLELSLACTMRIAATDLRCGFPEVKLGIFPALGATQRLPRIVGEAIALDLILTGRTVDAAQALQWGMVSRVVAPEELEGSGLELAEVLARRPPIAIRLATEAVRRSFDMSRLDGIAFERRIFGLVCGTADKAEGLQAWQEKRPASFSGK